MVFIRFFCFFFVLFLFSLRSLFSLRIMINAKSPDAFENLLLNLRARAGTNKIIINARGQAAVVFEFKKILFTNLLMCRPVARIPIVLSVQFTTDKIVCFISGRNCRKISPLYYSII